MTEIYDVAIKQTYIDEELCIILRKYSHEIHVKVPTKYSLDDKLDVKIGQSDIGMIEVFAPSGSCITARVFGRSDAIASIENLQLALRYCEGV